MRLEFFGVRGTFPGIGRSRTRYGVNTPCATVTAAGGETLVIDAGTGLRPLGDVLLAARKPRTPVKVTLFFTHFHLDHILGLPFFAPLYVADSVIDIYSWREPEEAREIVGRLSSEPLFPAPFATTPAKRSFHKIGEGGVDIGGVHVTYCPLNHPQGAAAYRFEERGKSIVFATDTEHPPEGIDKRLEDFARHASVFIYDAMYLPEEYEAGRQGWGHSTWLHGVRLAKAACAGTLYLSHFNPDHGDRVIRRMRKSARAEFRPSEAAREGLKIKL